MFSNILIVGCGLIGSSILRGSLSKKISKNIYVFEKSKKNISLIKKIDKKIKFLNKIDHKVSNMDLIVLSTHMSQYNNLIKKLLRYISSKNLITDTGSTKRNIENLINKNKKLKKVFIPSHPLTSDPAIGWLGINTFFNFLFLLIRFSIFRLVEPVSVIRFFDEMYISNFLIKLSY